MKKILLIIFAVLVIGLIVKLAINPKSANGPQQTLDSVENQEVGNEGDLASVIFQNIVVEYGYLLPDGVGAQEVEYTMTENNLNIDENPEYIIADITVRGNRIGGAQNDFYLLFGLINSQWKQIGSMGGSRYSISEEIENGYRKVTTYWHLGGFQSTVTEYKWNPLEQAYIEGSSYIEDI